METQKVKRSTLRKLKSLFCAFMLEHWYISNLHTWSIHHFQFSFPFLCKGFSPMILHYFINSQLEFQSLLQSVQEVDCSKEPPIVHVDDLKKTFEQL